MKKTITFLVLLTMLFPTWVFAEYSLPSADQKKVEKAITKINGVIDKRGEALREKLLTKINQILARPNLSEKNRAIFTQLHDWLQKRTTVTTRFNTAAEDQETQESYLFIFETAPNRCSENPCNTTQSFMKIRGEVANELVEFVEVNNYRLKSYQWSTWEYNPNVSYGNFSDWENTYTINYLSSTSEVLYTENFVINKILPEITISTDTSPNDTTTGTIRENASVSDWNIPYVDENEVREYWRSLLNKERTLLWLPDYTYDSSLDASAKTWSDLAVKRWYIDHKVDSPSDWYYDYWKKAAWMEDNGVVCKNISRATFSESIAWNNYYCSDTSKCTEEIKKAVKRTYDFYMSEKWTDYDPHYRAIAHPLFETMGLWLSSVNLWNGKYKMYLTNHYCTTNTK